MMNTSTEKKTTDPSGGDARLAALLEFLEQFDRTELRRSDAQRDLHRLWTMAALRHIYGDEYEARRPALLERFGAESFPESTALFMGQKCGKTLAIAMWVAAVLYTQRNRPIYVFSTAMRTSVAMHAKILQMLQRGAGDRAPLAIKAENAEELTIVNALGERTTAYTFPLSAELRGLSITGEAIAIVENASFATESALNRLVVPVLPSRAPWTLLTVSAPGGSCPWSDMLGVLRARGQSPFLVREYPERLAASGAGPFPPCTKVF